jgi:hypothetical protein
MGVFWSCAVRLRQHGRGALAQPEGCLLAEAFINPPPSRDVDPKTCQYKVRRELNLLAQSIDLIVKLNLFARPISSKI